MAAVHQAPFDLVVFGATSFVGRLVCEYLLGQFGVDGPLRWAMAARSSARLEALRAELGAAAGALPALVADATDAASLRSLCAQANVVASTVGPYARHGEPLVQACAESGTDYCDLSGEVPWMRRMIQRHEPAARASGARIVHGCGFDSIPSDLGVFVLQAEARARFGEPCRHVAMRVRRLRGGISGGTAASLLEVVREAAADPARRRELADPYVLCPPTSSPAARPRQPRLRGARFDADSGGWIAPFVMSAVNVPVVLRSQALLGSEYGDAFTYEEAVSTGRGLRGRLAANAMAAGLGAFAVAAAIAPTRWALRRFVLPAPGEGPGPEARRTGGFDLRFFGTTADGRRLQARVTGDRDPGYGATARMLGQAAACLAQDLAGSRGRRGAGGFPTPASLFGGRLVTRLRAQAGLAFDVFDAAPAA
jgi:short subunit dehydrogenase-like uncharacterized protein